MDNKKKEDIQKVISDQNEQLKAQLIATSLINEITKVMLASSNLSDVFNTIILGIKETMGFSRVVYFKIDKENFCLRPKIWAGIKDEDIKDINVPLGFMGGGTADAVFLNKHIIVDQVDKDIDPVAALNTKSYLVLPLVAKSTKKCKDFYNCNISECPAHDGHNPCCWSVMGSSMRNKVETEDERREICINCEMFKCVGVLWMDKPESEELVSSDQMTTLTTLAYQAGIIIDSFEMYNALENANTELTESHSKLAKLYGELNKAHAKINKDLDQARTIQTGLLPTKFTDTENLNVAAKYIPASQVGGDYYDLFRIDEDRFGVIVADVSGHGVAAAMVMTMTKVLLKTYCTKADTPRETLEMINSVFQNDIKTDNFVTVFYAVVDVKRKKIMHSSAGHNPVIIVNRKQKTQEIIKADGLFLGVFEDMMLCDNERDYHEGDRLVLYTDGLTEAENMGMEMYSFERLCDKAMKHCDKSPTEFVDYIIKDLDSYRGDKSLEDDVTMLVVDF